VPAEVRALKARFGGLSRVQHASPTAARPNPAHDMSPRRWCQSSLTASTCAQFAMVIAAFRQRRWRRTTARVGESCKRQSETPQFSPVWNFPISVPISS